MSLRKKLSHLKYLPELQPEKKWVRTTKYNLLSEIYVQNKLMKAQSLTSAEKLDIFGMRLGVRLMSQATKAIAVFLVLSIGSGLGVVAQAAVPGDTLWSLKRGLEKGELALAWGPVKETELHIKHAGKRLDEIDKILSETTDNNNSAADVQKEKAIKQAVSHLEKDVVAANTTLRVVKETGEKDPIAVVALAEKVTNATKETASTLAAKANDSQDKVIEEALDNAKQVNDDVKTSAVSLALEVHEEVVAKAVAQQDGGQAPINTPASTTVKIDDNNPSSQEVKAVQEAVSKMLDSAIQDLSSEVQGVKDKVQIVDEKSGVDAQSIDNIKKSPAEAQAGLNEAKELLDKGAFKDTLNKIVEVKEKTQATETVLKNIENQADEPKDNKNSTSTPPVNASSTRSLPIGQPIKSSSETTTDTEDINREIKAEEGIIMPENTETELFQ
ncbi:MAG: hypothetical protein WC465_01400 [Patescibacteria group bacterium]